LKSPGKPGFFFCRKPRSPGRLIPAEPPAHAPIALPVPGMRRGHSGLVLTSAGTWSLDPQRSSPMCTIQRLKLERLGE
jgi:hypothetical protein